MGFERFSFVPSDAHSVSGQANGKTTVLESFPQSKDLKEVDDVDLSCTTSIDDQTGTLKIPFYYIILLIHLAYKYPSQT
jgi:hypothetical protein